MARPSFYQAAGVGPELKRSNMSVGPSRTRCFLQHTVLLCTHTACVLDCVCECPVRLHMHTQVVISNGQSQTQTFPSGSHKAEQDNERRTRAGRLHHEGANYLLPGYSSDPPHPPTQPCNRTAVVHTTPANRNCLSCPVLFSLSLLLFLGLLALSCPSSGLQVS